MTTSSRDRGAASSEDRGAREPVDLSRFTTEGFDRGRSTPVVALWWIFKILIVQSRLPWPSRLRRAVLVAFGAKVGRNFYVRPSVNIHFPWRLEIGDNVWLGEGSTILNLEKVTIESNVAIAHEVYIAAAGHDIRAPRFDYANRPVLVRSGTWIGTRSYIGPGVTVGVGAVVAAGAVVISNVPDWAVVGGVPATTIGEREIEPREH